MQTAAKTPRSWAAVIDAAITVPSTAPIITGTAQRRMTVWSTAPRSRWAR